MQARDSRTRRRGSDSRTVYITAAALGLLVGILAASMNRQAGPAVPTVTFSVATSAPTPERAGFTLTP